MRKNLSSELGFSYEHRDINIQRTGFVASDIIKNGGIAVCRAHCTYDSIRKAVHATMYPHGGFLSVHFIDAT